MKAIRTSLIGLVASAAFAVAADSAPEGAPASQPEIPVFNFDAAGRQYAADELAHGLVAGETPWLSGALPRAFRLRSRAWQLISPFAPAEYGGLEQPEVAPLPRIFTDPVTHKTGWELFRLSW